VGDPTKAKENLGWLLVISIDEMIEEMVVSDLDQSKQHALHYKHDYSASVGVANYYASDEILNKEAKYYGRFKSKDLC
jgi:hypothetical protein